MRKKTPQCAGVFYRLTPSLLDLGFFKIRAARSRIVLFHFSLSGMVRLFLSVVQSGGTCRGIHSDLFTHGYSSDFSRRERVYPEHRLNAALVDTHALDETRRETKRFSDSIQKRWLCRFGRNRRLVRFLACERYYRLQGAYP